MRGNQGNGPPCRSEDHLHTVRKMPRLDDEQPSIWPDNAPVVAKPLSLDSHRGLQSRAPHCCRSAPPRHAGRRHRSGPEISAHCINMRSDDHADRNIAHGLGLIRGMQWSHDALGTRPEPPERPKNQRKKNEVLPNPREHNPCGNSTCIVLWIINRGGQGNWSDGAAVCGLRRLTKDQAHEQVRQKGPRRPNRRRQPRRCALRPAKERQIKLGPWRRPLCKQVGLPRRRQTLCMCHTSS